MTEKERLEKAREIYNNTNDVIVLHTLDELYPEFKETEDESIRKEIINFLELPHPQFVGKRDHEKWIAWLEKQEGCEYIKKDWLEHIKQSWYKEGFIDGKYSGGASKEWSINDAATLKELIDFLENGTAKLQHDLTKYANWLKIQFTPIEKQGGQKPTDKVEPKFQNGQWIVWKDKYYKVNYNGCGYELFDQNGLSTFWDYKTIEDNAHLWTIEDAKEGDVLSYVTDEEDLWIMIYWSLYEPYEGHVHYHALLVNDNFSDKGTCCICINDLKPATKEQRDILLKAMADAEYEWDSEKKELKKIGQKSVEWKQENREELTEFENAMMHIGGSFFGENAGLDPNDTETIKEQAELLLELAPKTEWSEEDEIKIISIISFLKSPSLCAMDGNKGIIDANIKYLKSIKDKIQSKPQWKPSGEQLDALMDAIQGFYACKEKNLLLDLYEQLKELKNE